MKHWVVATLRLFICSLVLIAAVPSGVTADNVLDTGVGRVNPGEYRLGLWCANYGLTGKLARLQLGSGTLPYIAWAFGVANANIEAKYEPWNHGAWRTSFGTGITWFRYTNDDIATSLLIVPLDARIAWAQGAYSLHTGLTANISSNSAKIDLSQFTTSAGLVGSVMYLPIGGYWQVGRHITLIAERRFYLYQTFGLSSETDINDRTTTHVYAEVPFNGRGMTTLDILFHWRHVGFKLGISSGDIEIPVLKFVVPAQLIIPRLDLYARF